MKRMRDLENMLQNVFPDGVLGVDNYGQIIIFTNKRRCCQEGDTLVDFKPTDILEDTDELE